MRTCVISGSTGLIGRVLSRLMIEKGWQLFSLERKPLFRNWGPVYSKRCDLSAQWETKGFPKKVDAVVHLAQSEDFRKFPDYANQIFNVNTWSTLKLLEYARRVEAKKFVYASSGGIYGYGRKGFKEEDTLAVRKNLGFYLGSKLCSEILAESYASYMDLIILRLFFVYGPGQRPDMLIPRLLTSVERGDPIVLHGQDGIRINPVYVSDAAQTILRALNLSSSETINIGGSEILTIRQIGEKIGTALGKKAIFLIQKDMEPYHLIGDIRKMSQLLWKPSVRFDEGILEMLKERRRD